MSLLFMCIFLIVSCVGANDADLDRPEANDADLGRPEVNDADLDYDKPDDIKTMLSDLKSQLALDMVALARDMSALARDLSQLSRDVREMKVSLVNQEVEEEGVGRVLEGVRRNLMMKIENSEGRIINAVNAASLATRNRSRNQETCPRQQQQLASMDSRLRQSITMLQNLQGSVTTFEPRDCSQLHTRGERSSGVYTIYPSDGRRLSVYCDISTSGGGWTVFQKRYDGSVDFYKNWDSYAKGFGSASREYWLGLLHVHSLSTSQTMELYIHLTDFTRGVRYARYSRFRIASESNKFRLTLGSYSGNAGDSMSVNNGLPFSTKDRDNDYWPWGCSYHRHGAWWYDKCSDSNLNGKFSRSRTVHKHYMYWWYLTDDYTSMKSSMMMIRPITFRS